MYFTNEDYEAAYDESFDEDYGEARPPRRGAARPAPKINTARAAPFRPPVPASVANSPVTQTQLKEVTARINAALATNGKALQQLDGRNRALGAEQSRLHDGLRKTAIAQKRDIAAVRKDLQSTREMSAIMPLLTGLAPGNPLMSIAPLLLLGNDVSATPDGGAPASSGGNFLGGMGGNNGMGLLALVALSGALTPKV
ncbi:hypothetical protein CDN99_12075 [Roseateles aquatilis]|uniref:Uncharacterized protein n=1 Tax=Roseateles aquatilis TaxID=431061 RepID=A0A246JEA0_9BURK|nr:hypothetical protein [Roseateles aquatilis]OWQ90891.1 hypothetical protein CDN99_12075 [Roseateles aquatilis]